MSYRIQKITASFGGVVNSPFITKEQCNEIRNDLMQLGVIVIRGYGLQTLDSFKELIGNIFPNAIDIKSHYLIHNKERPGNENEWHSDLTWMENPPSALAIQLTKMPPRGGDTIFVDTNACYDNLSLPIKELINGKTAIHDQKLFMQTHRDYNELSAEKITEDTKTEFEHPIVVEHTVTGKPYLNINRTYTTKLNDIEDPRMLNFICNSYTTPEFQYRHRWQLGDIIIWDNRSIIHYACSDYYPSERELNRTIVYEDRPVKMYSGNIATENNSPFQGNVARERNKTVQWFKK